ncbi:MAG: hypothetical protein E5V75_23975 [Mesorhizobium sp.]|nr:MAG: hypothetical protein E5V75_23975 [Mesorhizobium sp.]
MTDDEREKLGIEARRLQYHEFQETKRAAFQAQGEYGRWLIVSLLTIHGAAVLLPAQNPELVKTVLKTTFPWNVVGVLLTLACGFVAWVNWTLLARLYDDVTPGMIVGTEHWPTFNRRTLCWVTLTYWLAIGFGLVSVVCVVGAAWKAYATLP